jgi:putative membrane protein insertion efficiency factor
MNSIQSTDLPRPGPPGGAPGGVLTRLAATAIRTYQVARMGRVSPCRFTPTCSQYALEALQRHGARRGLALAARRLGRCRPGGPSGYDPIPE